MSESEAEEQAMALELETRCNIDTDTAREQAAWYSIMNTLALSLGSGMGIPASLEGLPNLSLKNPAPLKAFFKSGDPHIKDNFNEEDLATWRFSPDSFDKTLVPQAQGWSIIAETECAKWFGTVEGNDSLPERFYNEWQSNALMLAICAREQCEFAFENLRNENGLFAQAAMPGSVEITDSGTNMLDQACMLWACADAASLAGRQGIFFDSDARGRLLARADSLFLSIVSNKDSLMQSAIDNVQTWSVVVSAMVWYTAATEANELRARALWLLRECADNLVRAQDSNEMVGNTLVDAAVALRALTDAFRVTKLRTYAESASRIFNFIESQWWKLPGVYNQTPLASEYTYNADDIGIILGSLNASRLFLKERVNGDLAELRMRVFFCNAVDLAGLQLSMPSMNILPDWLKDREAEGHFRHPAVALPSQAGMAPVFAGDNECSSIVSISQTILQVFLRP